MSGPNNDPVMSATPGQVADLVWHWEQDRRVCDACGAEVWGFDDGWICSECERQIDGPGPISEGGAP